MRIKLEIDNNITSNQSHDKKSVLDMIVKENMTIGSLKNKLDISSEVIDRIIVNGVRRSEYYSLNSGDCITFKTGRNNREEGKELKSEAD
ncbi:hypothetical protein [Sporohalobacter salinus]|uniref:hypothetical protein n=1 Tax=Sporohalobacter salinus TaxID=1494606 RepID=UPI0019619120|nr:hypothetical protein [Sporohalobacter salinus]MBM7624522.1 hypothetical protein [Sporohalobacter salinus]